MVLKVFNRAISVTTRRTSNFQKRFFKTTTPGLSSTGFFTETHRDFLDASDFLKVLNQNGIDYFAGVPDSLLKDFTNCLSENSPNYHITANEGSAVALATGYHLATKKVPCVFLQNSGLGNTINPLLSLASAYQIPMILFCGWRGEPHKKDEPQHLLQGEVSQGLLDSINIKHSVLPDNIALAQDYIKDAVEYIRATSKPYVYLVKRQTFSKYKSQKADATQYRGDTKRFEFINALVKNIDVANSVILTTTGFTSREMLVLNEIEHLNVPNFYNVGAMGHVSMIATGVAKNTKKKVYCVDGDGSLIMHMGNLVTAGTQSPPNLTHVLINNAKHESVGNQGTNAENIDFDRIALACGYKNGFNVNSVDEFRNLISQDIEGPNFIQCNTITGSLEDLPRPSKTLVEYKVDFIKNIH